MQTRRTLVSMASVLSLAAVLAVLYGVWTASARADTETRYRFGGGGWLQEDLPLEASGDGDVVQIQIILDAPGVVSRWRLLTEGCVLDAAFHEERVALETGICGPQEVRLRGMYNGANALLLSVRGASPIRFNLAPSPLDPLLLTLELLAFLALALTLFLLRRFLHPDRTGTIYVWTFLLGVFLRGVLAAHALPGDVPGIALFLLSCAALAVLHVTAFSVRHGRGQAYLWTAGLLSAAFPLLLEIPDPTLELAACAAVAACVLWWEHPRLSLWLGVLLLLGIGLSLDAAFLGLWAGALLCLFRHPSVPPARQLLLFLLTCVAFGISLMLLSPLPVPTTDLFRAAVQTYPQVLPFSEPVAFFILLAAIIAMLRMREDGLRAARILVLLGSVLCAGIGWMYGGVSLSSTAVLLPAAVLLAADGVSRLAARKI